MSVCPRHQSSQESLNDKDRPRNSLGFFLHRICRVSAVPYGSIRQWLPLVQLCQISLHSCGFFSLTILVYYKGEEAAPQNWPTSVAAAGKLCFTVSTLLSKKAKSTSKCLGVLKAELISLLFIKLVWYFPLKYLFQLILLSDNFPWKNIKMKVGFVIAENGVGKKNLCFFYCIFICSAMLLI